LKLCYASDLHGRYALYRQLFDLVRQERPYALILGGDQCPLSFKPDNEMQQREWLRTTFRDFLGAVSPLCPVYWNSGNHELPSTLAALDELTRIYRIFLCDMRVLAAGDDLSIAGFPFGPISGWPFIDWELPDAGQRPADFNTTAHATIDGRLTAVQTSVHFAAGPSLEEQWSKLAIENPRTTLLVSHYPPFESGLDLTASEKSIGSRASLTHLAHHSYPLSLHGHVHEAPYLSAHWATRIDSTIAVNPGQWGDQLHAILFEWPEVAGTMTHTVFGCTWQVLATRSPASMRQELQAFWRSAGVPNV
jgi:Icc-related predicted phosphoesterase